MFFSFPRLSCVKNLTLILILLIAALTLSACHSNDAKKIGVIVPLSHNAMDEIVAGFTQTLSQQIDVPIKFKIANAQGDLNLQRAIIQQMRDENYDLVVPIGTATTQMTAAMIKHQPIVSLASIFTRAYQQPCNIAIVHDEISNQKLLAFIRAVYPALKELVLIHSTDDKTFSAALKIKNIAKDFKLHVTTMMVPTLNELYSITAHISPHTQAILILKDHLIASGINTLAHFAEKHHIPLITSDEGSVKSGASFSLGVHEREIGAQGAHVAANIILGKNPCDLPIVEMKNLTVFVNPRMLEREQQSIRPIRKAAMQLHYSIETIG